MKALALSWLLAVLIPIGLTPYKYEVVKVTRIGLLYHNCRHDSVCQPDPQLTVTNNSDFTVRGIFLGHTLTFAPHTETEFDVK